jgi:phosphoglycolate phosphatase
MKVKNIIFDLDGTLVDSSEGIISSFRQSFENCSVTPLRPVTKEIIGPPLMETLRKLSGSDSHTLLTSLKSKFIEYYDSQGYRLTKPFDGVCDQLLQFAAFDFTCYIATNKRKVPTCKILDYLNLKKIFKKIYSLDSVEPQVFNKSELIRYIIKAENLIASQTLYVGDRWDDWIAADNNSLSFAFANWGYGEKKSDDIPDSWIILNQPKDLFEKIELDIS